MATFQNIHSIPKTSNVVIPNGKTDRMASCPSIHSIPKTSNVVILSEAKDLNVKLRLAASVALRRGSK
jgi:hypothetical protein